MKLIDVVPLARVISAATICVVAGSANAQQIRSVQEGRQLAREVCAECHAIDNAAGGSTNPYAPTFKVIANTPGMTSAALTVALQTTHADHAQLCDKGRCFTEYHCLHPQLERKELKPTLGSRAKANGANKSKGLCSLPCQQETTLASRTAPSPRTFSRLTSVHYVPLFASSYRRS